MYRAFALTFVAVLAGAAVPPAGGAEPSVQLAVGSGSGTTGSEVAVPLTLGGASGLGAIHAEVTYDPAVVEARRVEKGPLAGNALMESNLKPGRVILSVISVDAVPGGGSSYGVHGDGVLAKIHFAVKAPQGRTSALALERVKAWDGATHHHVLVKTVAGQVDVTAPRGSPPVALFAGIAAGVLVLALAALLRRRRPVS